ncbi:MAG: hypothetical protein LBH21_06745 [Gracilibacteraceae bacterium]|jgi:hypothetical protein|nr:hypothetical protein [Gracilibacteraceae bacterium]
MRSLREINTKFMADEKKLDFYGTLGPDGWPHITVLNSLLQLDETTLVWGQFCQGLSKRNHQLNHKIGFLLLSPDKRILTGRADWLESRTAGAEFDMYNSIPRYRYNSYFGYSPVHYLKLARIGESQALDTAAYARARAMSEKLKSSVYEGASPDAVSVYTRSYFADPAAFLVLAYMDGDGYPHLLPLGQAVLTGASRVVFTPEPERETLTRLGERTKVAIYAITLQKMFSVLVKGELVWKRVGPDKLGVVEIEQVYNPMMPKPGYIYPRPCLRREVEFEDALYEYNV